jgi:ABC-2 type transport system ATP-binding protein
VSASPPPLSIEKLTKRFDKQVLAVDGLDLVVEEGQVLGLLGPNGAGKTTSLRMILGLIRPQSGRTLVFGEEILPGSPVLQKVGSLVDNPGFVPHLSGLRNLQLWWEAGGRRWAQADLDGALEVADLGTALGRKYRTYSHGMRQRLGLAQAVLGRPRLLILDEPTSGLDPQQMRHIREAVTRMARSGTTVLLSSHLLSEVEEVCTHAAVVDKGRLVTTGSVSDLTGTTRTVYLEVSDLDLARHALSALSGVTAVEDRPPGLLVTLGGA